MAWHGKVSPELFVVPERLSPPSPCHRDWASTRNAFRESLPSRVLEDPILKLSKSVRFHPAIPVTRRDTLNALRGGPAGKSYGYPKLSTSDLRADAADVHREIAGKNRLVNGEVDELAGRSFLGAVSARGTVEAGGDDGVVEIDR